MNERLVILLISVLVVIALALPLVVMGYSLRGRSGPRLIRSHRYY